MRTNSSTSDHCRTQADVLSQPQRTHRQPYRRSSDGVLPRTKHFELTAIISIESIERFDPSIPCAMGVDQGARAFWHVLRSVGELHKRPSFAILSQVQNATLHTGLPEVMTRLLAQLVQFLVFKTLWSQGVPGSGRRIHLKIVGSCRWC